MTKPPQGKPTKASSDERPPADGVQEAAGEYVDKAEAYRRYVQEGLDDIAAGRVHAWEDVKAELRAKYGVPRD